MFCFQPDVIKNLTNIGICSGHVARAVDLYTEDRLKNNTHADIRLTNIGDIGLRQMIMNSNRRALCLSKILT